jgi:hypothetical protein
MIELDLPLANWELRIRQLDALLRPIANRPVDITRRDWFRQLQRNAPPLEEAGVGPASDALLSELLSAYLNGTEEGREAIRELFVHYRAFTWAVTLAERPRTNGAFRRHLLLFSIKDQGRDSRDALLTLAEICHEAQAAGVDTCPLLEEIAAISSGIDRFGMGSTQQMLLQQSRS